MDETRTLHVSGAPVKDEKGVVKLIGAVVDITDRLASEKKLIEERNKFEGYI